MGLLPSPAPLPPEVLPEPHLLGHRSGLGYQAKWHPANQNVLVCHYPVCVPVGASLYLGISVILFVN